MKRFILFSIIIMAIRCGPPFEKKETVKEVDLEEYLTDVAATARDTTLMVSDSIVEITCGLDSLLLNPNISTTAKQLYSNTCKVNDDFPSKMLTHLNKIKKHQRPFYFKAITNSFKISDGAYSDVLFGLARNYVQEHTKKFVVFFDRPECFANNDLDAWSYAVSQHLRLENDGLSKDSILVDFDKNLQKSCSTCSQNQKGTLNKFMKSMDRQWSKN